MHISWLSLLSLLPAVLSYGVPKKIKRTDYKCPQIWVRKEWRNLKKAEQKTYLEAVKKIRARKTSTTATVIDKMVNLHGGISGDIHYVAPFLPWHRLFLVLYEELLQEVNSDIAQPYWHSTFDSQSPEDSPIFAIDAFGGNGKGPKSCVKDGTFSGMQVIYPERGCLSRDFDLNETPTFPGTGYINSKMTRSKTFEQMHEFVEARVHADPHNFVGGNLRSMYSPNDPIFFLHHGYIDKLWADWQKKHPKLAKTYGGTNADNSQASASDTLPYFEKHTVAQTFDTKVDLCYIYNDLVPPESSKLVPSKVVMRPNAEDEAESWEDERRLVRRRDKNISLISVKGAIERSKICGIPITPPIIVPVDDTIKVKPGPPTVDQLPKDDTLILKLRMPYRVPDEWFKLNRIPLEVARRIHEESLNITKQINKIPGYISPIALWNREDLLIKAAKKKSKLTAYINGTLIEFQKYSDDAAAAASEIKDKLKASILSDYIQKPVGEIVDEMVKVMGTPFYDILNPANPFYPRRPNEIGFGRGDLQTKSPAEVIKEKLSKGLLLRAPRSRHQISQKLRNKAEKWRSSYLRKHSRLQQSLTKRPKPEDDYETSSNDNEEA